MSTTERAGMLLAGRHLAFIILAARLTERKCHGPGAPFEGEEPDWGMLLTLSIYHASRYLAQTQRNRNG